MKKQDVAIGARVRFRHQNTDHLATVTKTDNADVEQVQVGDISPPANGAPLVLTLRAKDIEQHQGGLETPAFIHNEVPVPPPPAPPPNEKMKKGA